MRTPRYARVRFSRAGFSYVRFLSKGETSAQRVIADLSPSRGTLSIVKPHCTKHTSMKTAFLALGSNKGDRMRHLRRALRGLADRGVEVRRVSPVYQTEAHTLTPDEEQADYLNAVIEVRTAAAPHDLLALAKSLERAEGRDLSASRWSPRPLDIDLLTVGAVVLNTSDLTLPHPRCAERRFVLRPWADVSPNLVVPSPFDDTVSGLLRRCKDATRAVRLDEPLQGPRSPDER